MASVSVVAASIRLCGTYALKQCTSDPLADDDRGK